MYIPLENLTATPTQKEAIIHPQTPLMILAGAGTGKTFTLENRIVYLIKHYNVKPEHILTITYTEKAAGELQNRLANKIGQSVRDMTIGTFHSFCFRLLKDYKKSTLPYLLEESEAIHMFLENYDELGPFYSEEFSINPQLAVIKSFIPFFNRLRDELIDIERMTIPLDNENNISAETIAQLKDLKRIYPIFQKWKRDLNVVDYGDMILLCYQILQKNEAVLKIIQDKYRHVIIDEFQDNNFALNKIINYITEKQPQITVVGDENQTIYSFRGANSYNITEFKTKYKTTILSLEENFRSTQSILNLANASINKNTLQKKANVYTKKNPMGSIPKLFWGEKNEQLEYMSYENEPDLSITTLLQMTTAIPIFFKPIKYKECLYVDGGTAGGFATEIAGENYIGIHLKGPWTSDKKKTILDEIPIIDYFISGLAISVSDDAEPDSKKIIIPSDIHFTNFKLSLEEKQTLIDTGYELTKKHIQLYKLTNELLHHEGKDPTEED